MWYSTQIFFIASCSIALGSAFKCPWANGTFPSLQSQNCDLFWVCRNWLSDLVGCPVKQRFHVEKGECVDEAEVPCKEVWSLMEQLPQYIAELIPDQLKDRLPSNIRAYLNTHGIRGSVYPSGRAERQMQIDFASTPPNVRSRRAPSSKHSDETSEHEQHHSKHSESEHKDEKEHHEKSIEDHEKDKQYSEDEHHKSDEKHNDHKEIKKEFYHKEILPLPIPAPAAAAGAAAGVIPGVLGGAFPGFFGGNYLQNMMMGMYSRSPYENRHGQHGQHMRSEMQNIQLPDFEKEFFHR